MKISELFLQMNQSPLAPSPSTRLAQGGAGVVRRQDWDTGHTELCFAALSHHPTITPHAIADFFTSL